MSQRNPMNDRYTTHDGQGQTRKSAASAKPKNEAAANVRVVKSNYKTKAELKAARREANAKEREKERKYSTPPTKRYKTLRIIWWVCIVAAIASVLFSWLVAGYLSSQAAVVGSIVSSYVFIIAALVIDLGPIRAERKAYAARMSAVKTKESRAAERAEKRQEAELEAEAEEKYAAAKAKEEEKRQKRMAMLPGGKKRVERERAEKAAAEAEAEAQRLAEEAAKAKQSKSKSKSKPKLTKAQAAAAGTKADPTSERAKAIAQQKAEEEKAAAEYASKSKLGKLFSDR